MNPIDPAALWADSLAALRRIDWREAMAVTKDATIALVALTYCAGYACGIALDRFSRLWAAILAPVPVSQPEPTPQQAQPAAIPHRPLSLYRVKELRSLARAAKLPRSLYTSGRKAELIAALAY